MPTLLELENKRSEHVKAMQQLRDKFHADGGKWVDDTEAKWDAVNKDYDSTMEEIRKAKAGDEIDRRLKEVEHQSKKRNNPLNLGRGDAGERSGRGEDKITEETRCRAFAGYLARRFNMPCSKRTREAMQQCSQGQSANRKIQLASTEQVRALQNSFWSGNRVGSQKRMRQEWRDLSGIQLSLGGITVPDTLVRELNVNMLHFGGIAQVATIIVTNDGGEMIMPSADDTSNEGVLVSENSSQSSADPSFAGLTLRAYKYSSKFIKVPTELLEDNAVELASRIGAMLGERLGRITNRHHTVGDGAAKPYGLVTMATLGKTAASATVITYDEIIDLEHSVDVAYRTNATYMMHDNVVGAVRKLKDSSGGSGFGAYIFQPGQDSNVPDRINGFPLVINNHMDSALTNGKKIIAFGDMSKYIIRRVRGLRLLTLTERFADTDQQGFIGFQREDGGLFSAGTAPVKYLAMA